MYVHILYTANIMILYLPPRDLPTPGQPAAPSGTTLPAQPPSPPDTGNTVGLTPSPITRRCGLAPPGQSRGQPYAP